MKIGIVTVLYKSDSVIKGFLRSINAQSYKDFEVLFIENDVQNRYCEAAVVQLARFEHVFVRNRENVGVAAGNNQGLDYFLPNPEISHVLFLNNDTEFYPQFLQQHLERFRAHAYIDALAPKMFYFGTDRKVWYAGGKISYLKGGVRHFGHHKVDRLVGQDLYRVNYAPTCSLMVSAEVLRRTGIRMWEELFVYQDDYVFCRELSAANVRIYYTPNIELQHKISASTGGTLSDFSRYYQTRNWLYLGIRFRNLAVLGMAPLLLLYNVAQARFIELKAMRDAVRMVMRPRTE